ncbi:hypothetical protein I4U23_027568 [Adineta vaga]|nr:hypothetical protein I4U23_027568 [Adineta vaga]
MELSPTVATEQVPTEINIKKTTRRPLIHVFTGFRALACLWVFILHSGIYSSYEMVKFQIEWIGFAGEAGVAVFFCLSGFVMVWTYGDCEFKSTKCYWSFIGRRAARLFPLYYFALLLSIYNIRCVWSKEETCSTEHWIFIISTLFSIQTWIPYNFPFSSWNIVIWSVQTEWFFYLAFPFLLRLIRYLLNTTQISLLLHSDHKKNALTRLYVLWLLVLCISSSFLVIRLVLHDDLTIPILDRQSEIIYYSPFTRIPEFILGILTGIIFMLNSSSDNSTQATDTTHLLPSNDQQGYIEVESSINSKRYLANYNYHYLIFDIYFILQIVFFVIIYSPFLYHDWIVTPYRHIIGFGPIISIIVCINLYFSAKFPLSLTSRLLTTSLLINMGEISYAFYCLVEALPLVFLLISGMKEQSMIMKFFAGIGIAVFARHYIEIPFYTWANKKLTKCQCIH